MLVNEQQKVVRMRKAVDRMEADLQEVHSPAAPPDRRAAPRFFAHWARRLSARWARPGQVLDEKDRDIAGLERAVESLETDKVPPTPRYKLDTSRPSFRTKWTRLVTSQQGAAPAAPPRGGGRALGGRAAHGGARARRGRPRGQGGGRTGRRGPAV